MPDLPNVPLETDPTYLAFLRALDAGTQTAQAVAQHRAEQADSEYQARLASLRANGEITRENISGNMESRGIYRSGDHEVALARQMAGEGRQAAAYTANLGNTKANLIDNLALQRANQTQQAANATISAAGRVSTSGA